MIRVQWDKTGGVLFIKKNLSSINMPLFSELYSWKAFWGLDCCINLVLALGMGTDSKIPNPEIGSRYLGVLGSSLESAPVVRTEWLRSLKSRSFCWGEGGTPLACSPSLPAAFKPLPWEGQRVSLRGVSIYLSTFKAEGLAKRFTIPSKCSCPQRAHNEKKI